MPTAALKIAPDSNKLHHHQQHQHQQHHHDNNNREVQAALSLPASVKAIAISLRIMDSNGRLLANLDQQLSLQEEEDEDGSDGAPVACGASGGKGKGGVDGIATASAAGGMRPAVLAAPGENHNSKGRRPLEDEEVRLKLRRSRNCRVRFTDSDTGTANAVETITAATEPTSPTDLPIETPSKHSSATDSMLQTKLSSGQLMGRINSSLGRIARFAVEKQQQCNQQQYQKQCRSGIVHHAATSSDQYSSLTGGTANSQQPQHTTAASTAVNNENNDLDENYQPVAPIRVVKTSWDATVERYYAIDSTSSEDEKKRVVADQVPVAADATKRKLRVSNIPALTTTTTTPAATKAEADSLARLLCSRYQRDIILHTIGAVIERQMYQQAEASLIQDQQLLHPHRNLSSRELHQQQQRPQQLQQAKRSVKAKPNSRIH